MGNVLEKAKQEQVIALGRLGWSLRRIEEATGVRRETAGGYLRSAGIALRTPGGRGHSSPAKPATSVTTGSDGPKPAIEVITGSGGPKPANESKPATLVTAGFLPAKSPPEQAGRRSSGGREAVAGPQRDWHLAGSCRRARVHGRLPKRQALRAQAARSGIS